MRPFRSARTVAVLVVLTVIPLAACNRGGDTAAPSTGRTDPPLVTLPSGTTPTGAAVCNAAVLTPIVQTRYAGAVLAQVVCEPPFAMASVNGGAGLFGAGVAFLRFADGVWMLQAGGSAADGASVAPAGFSKGVISSWEVKYNQATAPPTPPKPKAPTTKAITTTTLGPSNAVCTEANDQYTCVTTTTTTAPPTTTTAPPSPPASAFCRANPFDSNCLDPTYPG
jgi:hypothetical protein